MFRALTEIAFQELVISGSARVNICGDCVGSSLKGYYLNNPLAFFFGFPKSSPIIFGPTKNNRQPI